jgi:hypothetical protein
VDEGTAIFKCTDRPPVGASRFVDWEGLPSDFYLKLVGQATRMIRGESYTVESHLSEGGERAAVTPASVRN